MKLQAVRTERFHTKVTAEGNEFTFGTVNGDTETLQLLKFISQSTPITDSFLSEYIKRNGKGLPLINDVYGWMKESLKIIFPDSRYEGISIRAEKTRTLLWLQNLYWSISIQGL